MNNANNSFNPNQLNKNVIINLKDKFILKDFNTNDSIKDSNNIIPKSEFNNLDNDKLFLRQNQNQIHVNNLKSFDNNPPKNNNNIDTSSKIKPPAYEHIASLRNNKNYKNEINNYNTSEYSNCLTNNSYFQFHEEHINDNNISDNMNQNSLFGSDNAFLQNFSTISNKNNNYLNFDYNSTIENEKI